MPPLQITGIEATQGIQYFGSTFPLCGPSNARVPCADNSLPLIEGKRTLFRTYVAGGTPGGSVSGIMFFTRNGFRHFQPAIPIPTPPIPLNRANRNHTLIFDLPEHSSKGGVTVDILVWDSTNPLVIPPNSPQTTFSVGFHPRALIKLRLVRINYVGRGMNVPAPTTAEFWRLTDFFLNTFPIPPPGIDIVANTVEKYDGDFTELSTYLTKNNSYGTTGTIDDILKGLKYSEGKSWDVVYGAIFSTRGANLQAGLLGGSRSFFKTFMTRVSTLPSDNKDDQRTFAHELAHALGQFHTPCGNPDNPDPAYPSYGLLPASSIGEVGIELYSNTMYDPLTAKDFMSYCKPKWISPYTYQNLFSSIGPPPVPHIYGGGGNSILRKIEVPYLMLWLRERLDRHVIVDIPMFVVPRPVPPHNAEGVYRVELLDQNGIVLVSQFFDPVPMFDAVQKDSDMGAGVPVAIRWTDEATRLIVFHDAEIILERQIEPTPPRLKIYLDIGKGPLTGEIDLSWLAESEHGIASVFVRYSPNGVDNWIGIPVQHGAKQQRINLDELPGGEECLIEVFASSGIRTASVRSRTFSVARKVDAPLILKPIHDTSVQLGEPVEMFGVPQSPADDPRLLIWSSNIDGQLGTGSRFIVEGLSSGHHKIELRSETRADCIAQINIVVESAK